MAQVGVVRTAVAHGERGERLPSTEQIQALCYVLEAQEEELIALTTGAFTATPAEEPTTWEEKEAELGGVWRRIGRPETRPKRRTGCNRLPT